MAIPKNPIEDTPVVGVEPIDEGPKNVDQLIGDENIVEGSYDTEFQEPIQVAGVIPKGVSKKAGQVINDGIDAWTDMLGGTDVLKSPNQKKKDKAKADNAKIAEDVINRGDSPLAIQDSEGEIFLRPLSVQEIDSVKDFIGGNVDFDVVLPNLNKISSDTGFKIKGEDGKFITSTAGDTADVQFKKLVAAMYEHYKKAKTPAGENILKKGERGFDDIIKDANKIGSVDIMLQLLKRESGDRPFTDAELLAARRTVLSFEILAQRHLKKFEKTGTDLDLAKASQALAISAYAQIQLTGVQEDLGRAVVSNRIIAHPGKGRINSLRTWADTNKIGDFTAALDEKNIAQFIEANGGRDTMMTMLAGYKNLPNDHTRSRFLKMTLLERAKLTPRMVMEIYQSALLSSGVTHAFNAAGQTVFMELLMVERFLMGEFGEGMAMLKAHATYLPQALKAMAHAFIHEQSITENVSKLDIDGRAITRHAFGLKSRLAGEDAGMTESAFAFAADGFGVSMRALGYRPMIAIDEFFKAMSRGMQIDAISFQAKSQAYKAKKKELMDAGVNAADADKQAKEFALETYIRTQQSDETFAEGSEFARMVTFQDDLPGLFQKVSPFMNSPIIKIWVPFYKTPTQIVRRVTERTPLAVFMPTVMKDKLINGSNRERREALTRITTGTALFATTMYMASGGIDDGFVITGYGPRDKKQRSRWLENHEPYSIGLKNEDGTFTWTSYARYDPVAGMLAMAADATDVFYNLEDDTTATDLLIGGGAATFRYGGTALPMTQFIGELIELAGSKFESHESKGERLLQLLAKQTFQAGAIVKEHVMSGGMMGVQIEGSMERSGYGNDAKIGDATVGSEYGSSTLPKDQYQDIDIPFWNRPSGLYPITRAWYEMLNSVCSKTIGCSENLPVKTNRWFEPLPQTRGTGWEVIQPWRVIDKPGKKVVNQELEKLGIGLPPLTLSMGEPMIKLNAEQYNRYIELYNDPSKSPFAKEYFKTEVYAFGELQMPQNIVKEYEELIGSDAYSTMPPQQPFAGDKREASSNKWKKDQLLGLDSEYKSYAKDLLVLEFPELKALLLQRDNFEGEMGRNPRILVNPTAGEIDKAGETNMEELFGVKNPL